ncbi:MAG: hypothetical protein HYX60_02995 [Legionella longbeachae]|nr:hypothetical protein [Legionella longbeachae]
MTLSISSLFGQSLNALSLSSPTTLAGLAMAGGVFAILATAAAASAIHKEWEEYKNSVHKAQIEEINRIYKKRLEKIESPNGTFLQGFPSIFIFNKDNKTVDSLHYNIDEIDEIGKNPPHIESVLASYREDILDAIRGLKEYYKDRGSKKYNDITSGVLSYLLNMLQNKCLGFEGYNNDIAYLDALTRFIDDYASLKGSKKTQHFSRLKPVYASLKTAKHKLERHQKSMPLRELVNELRETCIINSNNLLRLLIKMIIPTEQTDLGVSVTYKNLKKGILRGQYIRSEINGKIVWSWDSEIDLPESIFFNWIIGLAKYYKRALKPTSILQKTNTLQPEEFFRFSKWAQSLLQQENTSIKDKIKLHYELGLIRSIFKHSPNFINTKLGGDKKEQEYVPVKSDQETLERIEYIADFAHLIHAIISLQACCAHLISSIDQVGAIYINDPQHFNRIFSGLETLCKLIKTDLDKNRQNFLKIAKANKNTMRFAKEGILPDDVEHTFKAVDHMLVNLGQKVTGYKNHHAESIETATKAAITDILAVTQFFIEMYYPETKELIINPKLLGTSPNSSITASEPEQIIESSNQLRMMEAALNDLSTQISEQIATIKKEHPLNPEMSKYQQIWNTLRTLHIKSIEMLHEKSDEERKEKANKTYDLVFSIHHTTLEFLSLPQQERAKQSDVFIHRIHSELKNPDNAFIDKHRDSFSKFIYEHFGFFHTTTRNKFCALEKAYDGLQTVLSKIEIVS